MLEWIDTGMMEKPTAIINRLGTLIQGDITTALERFATKRLG
jgi:hypothetical protein